MTHFYSHYQLQSFSSGNKASLFGSFVAVNLVCVVVSVSLIKHGILSWCTVSVTFLFCFAQAATVLFRATETLGLEELLRLINREVLKCG